MHVQTSNGTIQKDATNNAKSQRLNSKLNLKAKTSLAHNFSNHVA